LHLDFAEIAGGLVADMYADKKFTAHGEVRAAAAKIGAQLNLSGAELRNSGRVALRLDDATIAGNVVANNGLSAEGKVQAVGVKIGGTLNLRGAMLSNCNGDVLSMDRAEVAGGVYADEDFTADGVVHALGAKIGGQLSLRGATLRKCGGCALVLDGAQITGNVYADNRFLTDGEFRARGARLGGDLRLSAANLCNEGGNALVLDNAKIAESVYANQGFTAFGEVRASGAEVNGELSIADAIIHNPEGAALDLSSAKVKILNLVPHTFHGSLSLYRAEIGDLRTSDAPPKPVLATGWVILDIHGHLRRKWKDARTWLESSPPDPGWPNVTARGASDSASGSRKSDPIPVQPFYELADVYENNGDPAAARRLRFSAANRVTRQSPFWTQCMRWVYCGLVGNGYYPLVAFVWLVVFLMAGWGIVTINREDVVSTKPELTTTVVKDHFNCHSANDPGCQQAQRWLPVTAETPCEVHPGYPCMNSFTFGSTPSCRPPGRLAQTGQSTQRPRSPLWWDCPQSSSPRGRWQRSCWPE
jgi:hypothetical protein